MAEAPKQRLRRSATPVPTLYADGSRWRRRLRSLLRPFWVVPMLWSLAAVLLGLVVPRADASWLADALPFLFPGDVDGARSVLSTIAGAMISVTGLVFSNTMVVLQLASSQFSPRVLQTFLQSRVTQHTLGVFLATFLYALTVLRSFSGHSSDAVPQVAVTLSYLFVLAAVGMFLTFISHITSAVGVANIVRRAADETRDLLTRASDRREALPQERPDLPALSGQHVATSTSSGYLDGIDHGRLRGLARKHDVRIELLHPLGTFVVEGSPIAMVHGGRSGDDTDWDSRICSGVDLARERSMQQDPAYGFRRLVDIAERALSPGINDPTTAVQVVDQIHDLLRRMAGTEDPYPVVEDEDGVARVVTRERTFEDYLDLAIDEIAHWGADSIQIPPRLEAMLADVEAAATPAHRAAVVAKRSTLAASDS